MNQKYLRFTPNPEMPGCYWSSDGYMADLGWNPYEQLEIRAVSYMPPVVKKRKRKDYDRYTLVDIEIQEYETVEFEAGIACEWCYRVINDEIEDLEDGICLSCLYRICASCGKTFKATSRISRTCSSECAEILGTERGRWLIFERDDFTCIYCGMSAPEDATRLHVDHIIPVAEGGKSRAGNLITSCVSCNLEKSKNRMTDKNESEILAIAANRNKERNIENSRRIRIRASDRV